MLFLVPKITFRWRNNRSSNRNIAYVAEIINFIRLKTDQTYRSLTNIYMAWNCVKQSINHFLFTEQNSKTYQHPIQEQNNATTQFFCLFVFTIAEINKLGKREQKACGCTETHFLPDRSFHCENVLCKVILKEFKISCYFLLIKTHSYYTPNCKGVTAYQKPLWGIMILKSLV